MEQQQEAEAAASDPEFDTLKAKIHVERGFNCAAYKDNCLRRRIAVRMRARGLESFVDYARLLEADPAEYELLLDTLTVNVSKFFRNPEIWASVAERVIGPLFESPLPVLRIWSAGCAGGEEPYSVAILLREWAERHGAQADLERFRILGTDIDRRSLEVAQKAEYPELALTDVPADLRQRWFSDGPPYRLDPRLRSNVAFEHRDLISDPAPTELSLIVCRNVIIYFDRAIQERLFHRFFEALVPGGVLVLGKVETLLGPPRSLFRPLVPRARIFRKPE